MAMDCQQDSRRGLGWYDALECGYICTCFSTYNTCRSLHYGCSLVEGSSSVL